MKAFLNELMMAAMASALLACVGAAMGFLIAQIFDTFPMPEKSKIALLSFCLGVIAAREFLLAFCWWGAARQERAK